MRMTSTPTSPTCLFGTLILGDLLEQPEMTALRTQTLSDNWEWRQRPNGTSDLDALAGADEWTRTSVPTEVFRDLLEAGKIRDPHLDLNEKTVQWVGEVDWVYRTRFSVDKTLAEKEKAVLAFDGLDTYANVYLNGERILKSENMFHEHRVDVTSRLKSGQNDLGIIFESALQKGREEISKRGNLMCWNGEPSRLYVRKAQYHWGWDWGPVMMSAGPWKPIHLEIYQSRIEETRFPVSISDDLSSAKIGYTIKVESPSPEITVCVTLIPPDDSSPVYSENLSINSAKVEGSISIDNPILWYPVGYGAQSRYQLIVKLHANNKVLDTQTRHLGFRLARVIQEPLNSEPGMTFYFSINNIPIFCGGSNWIPADNILTRLSPDKYHKWLSLAVNGNQNVIRVWGGGIYEHEAFYDAADELGLLVWQDFCFACGQYPAHKEFRESVKREAEVQCKRLRWHPSVVLFAGNNEDYQVAESASLGWDPSEKDPEKWLKSNFPARYLYEKLLPEVVSEHAPGVFYHPGSPWGGGNPTTDNTVGDIHQWNVWHGTQQPYQLYPSLGGRFVSEFGMQGLPSQRTLESFITHPRERYPQSQTMDHHNKAAGFERRLGPYILENFRLHGFDLETYRRESQRMQADALGCAYRGWRRLWRDRVTSGALVWQLNDCWPCTSWSIVDFFLRPKLAWYAVSRELRPVNFAISRTTNFNEPVLLPQPPGTMDSETKTKEVHSAPHAYGETITTVDVWGVNSTLKRHEISATIQFFEISSGKKIFEENRKASLSSNSSTEVATFDVTKYNPADLVVSVLFIDPSGEVLRSSADWPQPLKYIDFSKREVTIRVEGEVVSLKASKPIKAVMLDFEGDDELGLEWSDNGFDIMPGEGVKVIAMGLRGRQVTANWYGSDS